MKTDGYGHTNMHTGDRVKRREGDGCMEQREIDIDIQRKTETKRKGSKRLKPGREGKREKEREKQEERGKQRETKRWRETETLRKGDRDTWDRKRHENVYMNEVDFGFQILDPLLPLPLYYTHEL